MEAILRLNDTSLGPYVKGWVLLAKTVHNAAPLIRIVRLLGPAWSPHCRPKVSDLKWNPTLGWMALVLALTSKGWILLAKTVR